MKQYSGKFFASFAEYTHFKRHVLHNLSAANLIIYLLLHANGPVTKSDIIGQIKRLFWEGWRSSRFVQISKHTDKVFDYMARCGALIYTPRKPVVLFEEDPVQ